MPSIFSRSRLNSTPKRSATEPSLDEFGRVSSRGSAQGTLSTKKDKKSKGKSKNGAALDLEPQEPAVPDGSFLQTNLDPQRYEPGEEPSQERRQLHDYGYLSYQRHVVLGPEEVARLVDVVGNELGTRGLTTPFIFSSLALDVSANAVKRLINVFLNTCRSGRPTEAVERQWRDEVRFAGPQELGMFLRWGLGRVVRIVGGQEVRGLLSYDMYVGWAEHEAACNYPPLHFDLFVDQLEPIIRPILVGLLTLLSKFTAHSSSSGHTPPTLSPLFGPLLFGLGPSTLAFHHVYRHYLRAVTATEHIILSFIRWQDAPLPGSTSTALGVPTRLKAWIQGYPAMLPAMNHHERPQPRRGARTTRVISVRRNVRMYSADLVKTAASWGIRPRGMPSSQTSDRAFASSKEWDRISPPTLKLAPRYSDSYRKRMDLPAHFHPETGAGSSASTVSAPSLSTSISSSSTTSSLFDDKELGVLGAGRTPEERFRSLTDLKWGEFEAMGFGDLAADNKKLQFDLTESARAARAAKRATLSWQDFSAAGFSRTDDPLSVTLQFSHPVTNTINTWPSQSAEIHRKLKKTQKALPTFGWDTEPVLGSEEVIEEAFLDVFCDLIYGGGWMDVERYEEVDRDCNWALVEFRSLPVSKTHTVSGTSDPRSSTTLILFEEFVPLEYRQQLQANGSSSRRRLPSLFGTSSKRQWKPAQTLNGRPYVVGHVPHSPSYREVEFEGLLRSNESATKMLSLKTADKLPPVSVKSPLAGSPISNFTNSPAQEKPNIFLSPVSAVDSPPQRPSSRSSDNHDSTPTSTPNPNRKSGRFRIPGTPVGNRTAGLAPAEYENVDFEARLASFDDDEPAGAATGSKNRRQRVNDDAWVDILVANNGRRLDSQDAVLRNGFKPGRSDPDLASQELSEVMAAVRAHPLSDDEDAASELVPVSEDSASHVSTYREEDNEGERSTIHGRESDLYADEVEEEEEEQEIKPASRRLGYFDLHPERRLGNIEPTSTRPILQVPASPGLSVEGTEESTYSEHEDAYDGVQPSSTPNTLIPPRVTIAPAVHRSPSPNGNGHAVPVVAVSPPLEEAPQTAAQSKTSTLIEMYRERERNTPLGARPMPNAPVPRPVSPARSASESAVSVELDDSLTDPIRPAAYEKSGLATPPRYVHGAPLHNVLEEEEEEEE
ncbi:hypothetical protein BC629DRAFT_1289715 [Irpex lacteus]|nr:hypothetical protein BC629DRAFT_1289715 [Irpex lacteus]